MRHRLIALCLASVPSIVLADSLHAIVVVNDTSSRIDSFAVAPAGSARWAEASFRNIGESWFESQIAVRVQFHDDDGCFRDLRTTFSDGRRVLARNFNVCRYHSYQPGRYFYNGHPGSRIMP